MTPLRIQIHNEENTYIYIIYKMYNGVEIAIDTEEKKILKNYKNYKHMQLSYSFFTPLHLQTTSTFNNKKKNVEENY